MTITELDIYRKTRELLSDSDRRTKGAMARTENGSIVATNDPKATCWCLVGALSLYVPFCSVFYDRALQTVPTLVALARRIVPDEQPLNTLLKFNDTQPHAAVIGLLDEAIATLQPQPA